MIERSPEVEQSMRDAFAMMQRGDIAALLERTSTQPGVVMIGSDPEEWYVGREAIQRMASEAAAAGGEIPRSSMDDIEGYREGDLGFATIRGTWTVGDTSVPFRLTAVVHLEDGEWKAVQNHASIGVPNTEMMNPMFQAEGAAAS
jgi:ketosteroid isomerase-like protein